MNVKRCVFRIGRLIEQGFGIDFERQILTAPDGRQARVHRQGRLYYLRAQLLESEQSTQMNPVWVDEHDMNEHAEDNEDAHTVGEHLDGQTAKGVREPRQPAEKERREHSFTHVPLRNWCKACVLVALKMRIRIGHGHVVRKESIKTRPQFQLDYMFPWG